MSPCSLKLEQPHQLQRRAPSARARSRRLVLRLCGCGDGLRGGRGPSRGGGGTANRRGRQLIRLRPVRLGLAPAAVVRAEASHLAAVPVPEQLQPARAFPSSIFCDKNRRDIGKSQSKWTASKMETPGSPRVDGELEPVHHIPGRHLACDVTRLATEPSRHAARTGEDTRHPPPFSSKHKQAKIATWQLASCALTPSVRIAVSTLASSASPSFAASDACSARIPASPMYSCAATAAAAASSLRWVAAWRQPRSPGACGSEWARASGWLHHDHRAPQAERASLGAPCPRVSAG
jgi:hypothetical protein